MSFESGKNSIFSFVVVTTLISEISGPFTLVILPDALNDAEILSSNTSLSFT